MSTSKRITIGRESNLQSGIGYRCDLSKQLNSVSEIAGEVQSNLAGHYERIGATKAAAYYSERVIRYRETNLFYLYARGTSALQEGNYKGAIKSLRKSIRLARDRPEFYLGLHRAYELAGKKESSERNLALALYYQQNPGSVRNRNTVRVISDPDADRFLGTPSNVIYTD